MILPVNKNGEDGKIRSSPLFVKTVDRSINRFGLGQAIDLFFGDPAFGTEHVETFKTLHASLRVGGKIRKKRNVMKRFERLNVLRAEGRIAEDKVYGLPKTKPID